MIIRVYYEDTDANGIVYHANYIKLCDRSRSEYFFKHNITMTENGGYLVIRELNAKYYRPSYLGDELLVTSEIKEIHEASVSVYHEIYRKSKMEKVFSMHISLVYINNGLPDQLPDSFLKLFKQFNTEQELKKASL